MNLQNRLLWARFDLVNVCFLILIIFIYCKIIVLAYAFQTLTHYCNYIRFTIVLEHVNENDYLMDNENQNCSIDSPCANLEFCNYDKKMSGFCEDCPANASCCSYIGLPLNGPWDCKSACSINDKEEDQEECEIGGDYYYKYALDLPENETGIEI